MSGRAHIAVNDHRAAFETSDTEKALEGGLEDLSDAYLRNNTVSKQAGYECLKERLQMLV